MPTPVKTTENTTKHWTNPEKDAREQAEQEFERRFVRLVAPPLVCADPVAKKYWSNTIKRMKGITLLDNVDIDMLSVYCLALSRLDQLRADAEGSAKQGEAMIMRVIHGFLSGEYGDDDKAPAKLIRACLLNEADIIKLAQAQERIVLQYAEKLGLTPAGRVRLAKKRAEERPATEADDLYG